MAHNGLLSYLISCSILLVSVSSGINVDKTVRSLVEACPPYQDHSQGLPPLMKACRGPEMGTRSSWTLARDVRLEMLELGTNQTVGIQKRYRLKFTHVGA